MIKLAKSGGVVVRPAEARKKAREQRVREYFYGVKGNLMPFSNTVRAEELQVYRIGAWPDGQWAPPRQGPGRR